MSLLDKKKIPIIAAVCASAAVVGLVVFSSLRPESMGDSGQGKTLIASQSDVSEKHIYKKYSDQFMADADIVSPYHEQADVLLAKSYQFDNQKIVSLLFGGDKTTKQCRKTQNFYLPVKKKRDGTMKIPPGSIVMTCFTSDFLLKDADEWRHECWEMIKSRDDCMFYFFTKRIERFLECVPADWGDGYENVMVGCTCENQDRADFRLPIFAELPIKYKTIILAPMLGPVDLEKYLDSGICEVTCSGESGINVRPLDYEWVLDVRRQCMNKGVPFQFHQTGAYFIKDGKIYRIPRRFQASQARKAGIDYKIVDGTIPDF